LQQAHEAFVCGVPFATIALLRSILEATLKDHYGATGENLEERINISGLSLTVRRTLHKLRHLANDIMHFDKINVRMPSDIERELVTYLNALRDLIEGAPPNPRARTISRKITR
jgi:hypothetical protein